MQGDVKRGLGSIVAGHDTFYIFKNILHQEGITELFQVYLRKEVQY